MFRSILQKLFTRPPKASNSRKRLGEIGEETALRYLQSHTSMHLIARNWSNGRQEIDLIFKDGSVLVFVEVRARSIRTKVPGFASLNPKKRQNLRIAAYSYMNTLRTRPNTYRYDAVELRMDGDQARDIHYFKNIRVFSKESPRR